MKGDLIYDSFQTGSDGQALGLIILTCIFTVLFIIASFRAHNARRDGKPIRTAFWNSVADRPVQSVVGACIVGLSIIFPLSRHSLGDWLRLSRGDYTVLNGSLEQNVVRQITGVPRRQSFSDRDQVRVAGVAFYISCDRPYGVYSIATGDPGGCLAATLGDTVEVDAVQLSPAQFRAEPLRIWRATQ